MSNGIFSTFKKKGKIKKGFFPDKKVISNNIYKQGLTGKQYRKRFNFFHFVFKYKFFIPLLKIVRIFLDKYIEPVPLRPHNKNIILFDKAFEKSISDWSKYFICTLKKENYGSKINKKELEKVLGCESVKLLRTLKEVVIAGAINDTAYREFLNILMFNVAKFVNKNYPEKAEHLFYLNKNVDEVLYYYIWFIKEKGNKLKNIKIKNYKNVKGERVSKIIIMEDKKNGQKK